MSGRKRLRRRSKMVRWTCRFDDDAGIRLAGFWDEDIM
jgi:hypothetical protein